MITHSFESNAVFVGSSVHNVRIERLWRDTFRCVLSVFYELFYSLEDQGKLDSLSEKHLFSLHYIYLPRISKALDAFMSGWNSHAITTEACMTPLQLFTSGVLSSGICQDNYCDHNSVYESILPDTTGVEVPQLNSPLSQSQEDELRRLINPLQESVNYAVDLYEQVLTLVEANT